MRIFVTFVVTLLMTGLMAVFVWGWYQGRMIPEVIFGALLTLVGSLVGYMWLRPQEKQIIQEKRIIQEKQPVQEKQKKY
ncbi:MAG: hypothetical protein ACRCYY_21490 [Trueperaceae bacterium]